MACRGLPEAWSRCNEYLYGVDLFNRSFLWEAHEAWEVVWIGAGKDSEPAQFTQGLIQTSASLLRMHLRTPSGARRLLVKAGKKLDRIQNRETAGEWATYMGVAIEPWREEVRDFLNQESGSYPFLRLRRGST